MNFTDLFVLHPSHGYILQILFAELLFFPFFKRRKHFVLRAVFSFAFYVVCSIRLTNLLNQVIKGLSSITIFLLSFLGLIFCFENKVKDLLFCCVGAQLIQNLSHNIENLIYLPLKNQINTLGWFFLSASVRLVLYGLCFFMIYRFSDLSKGVNFREEVFFQLPFSLLGSATFFSSFFKYMKSMASGLPVFRLCSVTLSL